MLNNELRHRIIQRLQIELSIQRYEHVLRVEQQAIILAKRYGIDVKSCQLAALLHDIAKEWTMEAYEKVVQTHQLDTALLSYGSEILHGPVGACVAKEWFGVNDESVCQAIACHTIGDVYMSEVAKVLFVADYIESGRSFEGVDEARRLAHSHLDLAVAYKLQKTIQHLTTKRFKIYPKTILAYNAWIDKLQTGESF